MAGGPTGVGWNENKRVNFPPGASEGGEKSTGVAGHGAESLLSGDSYQSPSKNAKSGPKKRGGTT